MPALGKDAGPVPRDLKRFGKLESSECWFCGDPIDDAAHTLFVCDAWHQKRRQVEIPLHTVLNAGNLVQTMLASKANWDMVSNMLQDIIKSKEAEERRRQAMQAD
ncbi:Retrovirus-related Pol polyprotein from type-1 retrotransposable element R1 2 [Aphis craccivora]|uniref:Retrovirus-related Pol polyprotein from type-1 retrotransposable element R1 2 n=1 Tax=Aphis craccivora TaxID=307492 RepID=A0A6G0VVW5_APHCR|nr:Retrovirus-related Pol polyprotein from type-1 retrotransposable element R1 2 [Aphis craccivora]